MPCRRTCSTAHGIFPLDDFVTWNGTQVQVGLGFQHGRVTPYTLSPLNKGSVVLEHGVSRTVSANVGRGFACELSVSLLRSLLFLVPLLADDCDDGSSRTSTADLVTMQSARDSTVQSIGQVKKVEISYGPGGVSRGIAHVTFQHADGASKAFQTLNGLLIDNKPVKVEVVVASADLIPQPKPLAQRIVQPKAQPKSAATVKQNGATAKAGAAATKGAKKPRRGRSHRPVKKTAEELDSEMADYFDNANAADANANAAAPAAAAGGDAAMDEDVL
ncbi:hypothetical protein VTJ49DRAFT_1310 [Mycothermus thermophilus]|uniref:RRM domain-containing protein n=1 Tax=Humicola insolens TaxID=85995 RepID=A0ABR3VCU0_HUMIN